MVIVGAGHIGTALANYDNFRRRGFVITSLFDNRPELIGMYIGGILVRDIKELQEYIQAESIEIGIIATPAEAAQETANRLVAGGVEGIWNFAPVNVKVPNDVILENEYISESLFLLSFKLQHKKHSPK